MTELEPTEAFILTLGRNVGRDSIKRKLHGNPSIEKTPAEKPDPTTNPYEDMLENYRVLLERDIIDALPEKQKTSMIKEVILGNNIGNIIKYKKHRAYEKAAFSGDSPAWQLF